MQSHNLVSKVTNHKLLCISGTSVLIKGFLTPGAYVANHMWES